MAKELTDSLIRDFDTEMARLQSSGINPTPQIFFYKIKKTINFAREPKYDYCSAAHYQPNGKYHIKFGFIPTKKIENNNSDNDKIMIDDLTKDNVFDESILTNYKKHDCFLLLTGSNKKFPCKVCSLNPLDITL